MKENKYRRPITARAVRNGGMDVYDVLTAFGVTCPALAHAVKKILCPGQRGAKDKLQDLKEAAWSLADAIQFAEDAAGTSAPHEKGEPKTMCQTCYGAMLIRALSVDGLYKTQPCPVCNPVREGK